VPRRSSGINSRLNTRNGTLLTGFNTDVEYGGVVYHVQTEDKGLQTPFILSLVYTGGAILASKRSPYDDLIAEGFDESVLAGRLSRQHKLICAAVHAGRIEDLKRLGERDVAEMAARRQEASAKIAESREAEPDSEPAVTPVVEDPAEPVAEPPDHFALTGSDKDHEPLRVILLDDTELKSGESVTLRVLVSRAGPGRRQPARKARVVVKVLGSNFRPTSTLATTNAQGTAMIPILLPSFEGGRAAVLVQAHIDGETCEVRRIILPAQAS
jgi:hypothetical protein